MGEMLLFKFTTNTTDPFVQSLVSQLRTAVKRKLTSPNKPLPEGH